MAVAGAFQARISVMGSPRRVATIEIGPRDSIVATRHGFEDEDDCEKSQEISTKAEPAPRRSRLVEPNQHHTGTMTDPKREFPNPPDPSLGPEEKDG